MRRGALLHDIGKMGIPDRILQKPGPLTDDEWDIMRQHPAYAFEMLAPIAYLRRPWIFPVTTMSDGMRRVSARLKGREIPLAARIFAVVDIWDALCSTVPTATVGPERTFANTSRISPGLTWTPMVVREFLNLEATLTEAQESLPNTL